MPKREKLQKKLNDLIERVMLRLFPFRWQLHVYEREKNSLITEWKNKLGQTTDPDEFLRFNEKSQVEFGKINDEIDLHITNFLLSQAKKFIIPIPDKEDKEMWASDVDPEFFELKANRLSDKGIYTLRSAIRKEKKERIERFLLVVGALTGLGGVAIGILSIVLK